jgi:hypothetical protein
VLTSTVPIKPVTPVTKKVRCLSHRVMLLSSAASPFVCAGALQNEHQTNQVSSCVRWRFESLGRQVSFPLASLIALPIKQVLQLFKRRSIQ